MDAQLKRSELKAHIAKVAALLFYRQGIHAVGVDRIAGEARVTKRTLYHHYPSKDDLIAAALRESPLVNFPREGSPVERLLGAFTSLATFLKDTEYRGCPFIFFTSELLDRNHPARKIIDQAVAARRDWFRGLCEKAGARDPQILAEQLDVLFDGALASGAKRGDLRAPQAALAAARTLVEMYTGESTKPKKTRRHGDRILV